MSERYSEQSQLEELYNRLYDEGLFIKEWSVPQGYMAMVGSQAELKSYLGLAEDEELTEEHIANLGIVMAFAPGTGDTRVEAIQDAYDVLKGSQAAAEKGLLKYGSFTLGQATVTAYMPASSKVPRRWTIHIERPDQPQAVEYVDMIHEPIFGADAEDIANLEEAVECLIVTYELE